MKSFLSSFIPAVLALALLTAPDRAAAAPPSTAQDRADIARVEDYLNNIRTMQAEFLQVTPSGDTLGGQFYLRRPGRLRFEYTAPKGNFVVADGTFIYFWDNKLKQQSQTLIGSTLANFILQENIRLTGNVTVTDIQRGAGKLELTMALAKDPGAGRLTLQFTDNPLELRQWTVVDPQGLTTQVSLINPRQGMSLDTNLFWFREPDAGPKYN